MTWLDIAVTILIGLVAGGAVIVGLWMVTAIIVIGWRHRGDPYPGQAAEAPDPVDAHADTVPVERTQPWTGDNVTIAVPDPGWLREIYTAIDAYRRGEDLGGMREASPLTRWTEKGWLPIRDWRLARTDKRWWS